MTNKMPVVGQRYLSTRTGWECELKRFNEETATAYDKYGTRLECVATRFWDYFEELPEDNLQETKEVPVVASKDFMEGYNAGWNDFGFKKDYRFKESTDNEPKGNKTPNPVDFEKGEVNKVERALEAEKKPFFKVREEGYFEGLPPSKEALARSEETLKRMKEERVEPVSIIEEVDGDGFHLKIDGELFIITNNGKEYYRGKERLSGIGVTPSSVIVSFINEKTNHNLVLKERTVEPVSIWKDVSELPRSSDVIIQYDYHADQHYTGIVTGYFNEIDKTFSTMKGDRNIPCSHIVKYTTLTNFVNAFEQMQKDFKELKRK